MKNFIETVAMSLVAIRMLQSVLRLYSTGFFC
jgi:hypothetical protein